MLNFKLDQRTSCEAGREWEQSPLLSPPPQLAFKDGINCLYKRYQRKVPLRVPVSIASLGGRPGNRVLSVCRAGLEALARANEVVLIIREASPSR